MSWAFLLRVLPPFPTALSLQHLLLFALPSALCACERPAKLMAEALASQALFPIPQQPVREMHGGMA